MIRFRRDCRTAPQNDKNIQNGQNKAMNSVAPPNGIFASIEHSVSIMPILGLPCPRTPVRGVAKPARRRACLRSASTSDEPFCAAARMATAVVLARSSGPERVRLAAPTTVAAKRGSACCSAGAGGLWFCPLYDI